MAALSTRNGAESVELAIERLGTLDGEALRIEWRNLFGRRAPQALPKSLRSPTASRRWSSATLIRIRCGCSRHTPPRAREAGAAAFEWRSSPSPAGPPRGLRRNRAECSTPPQRDSPPPAPPPPGRDRRRAGARGIWRPPAALGTIEGPIKGPIIEVHISNVHQREEFRRHSYLSAVASGVIVGCGAQGYGLALKARTQLTHSRNSLIRFAL